MDLREAFVARAMEPESNISELCREYGISRKTAYVWLKRFKTEGRRGLVDRSHRPKRVRNISGEMVLRILELRKQHRFWGPRKLQKLLLREFTEGVPSEKTVARVLKRAGSPPVRRRALPMKKHAQRVGGALRASQPNEVWTFDFKGWWKTRDGQRFEPLTVRDAATRFILLCVHCRETFVDVKRHCEELFTRYGLPERIRSDNGPPFAASDAMGGLSRLSAWWVSLGIEVDFSRPATPSDNGAHERMHGDIQEQLSAQPADNVDAQQLLVDDWVRLFNHVRPHESLQLETPASRFGRSKRRMKQLTPQYPADALKLRVSARGRIMLDGHQYFVGTNLAGFHIGLRRRDEEKQVLFFGRELGTLQSTPQRVR